MGWDTLERLLSAEAPGVVVKAPAVKAAVAVVTVEQVAQALAQAEPEA
jgi:hypothetical protein